MKVAITGTTGLIGRALTTSLMSDGHEVIALSRTAGTVGDVTTTVWDASTSALPRSAFEGVDAFVGAVCAGNSAAAEHCAWGPSPPSRGQDVSRPQRTRVRRAHRSLSRKGGMLRRYGRGSG
jgi:nucleoside-diphosphate-sugar epimerase